MKHHYVERARLDEELERLTDEGHTLVAVFPEGDNFQLFTSEPKTKRQAPGSIEKRA